MGDGIDQEALVTLTALTPSLAEFSVQSNGSRTEEFPHTVHLFVSILKRDNFEWVAQKAIECGARSITPISSSRTIKMGLNYDRILKIMHEATEQSGRIKLSKLHETISYTEAILEVAKQNIPFYIADKDGMESASSPQKDVALFIGPEGGFTDEEKKFALEHGAKLLSLGTTTLRAETAAILGTFVLTNA